ncbi:hypothetical protein [Rhodoplanes azumiensis]|uniref:Uncharacterized protein n=1 Tax=Rhodoplanes azumiensis TaxID=1897628 RepID=A0ABW5APT2_9BRAD
MLEMPRQDFRLAIPEREPDLPADRTGADVARVRQIVRARVRDTPGRAVTPDVVLSTVSFTMSLTGTVRWTTWTCSRRARWHHLIDAQRHGNGDGAILPDAAVAHPDNRQGGLDALPPLDATDIRGDRRIADGEFMNVTRGARRWPSVPPMIGALGRNATPPCVGPLR